jgi:ATP phosphoribosyltransferase regulatory subunit
VVRSEFGRWGYREVLTPTIEYLETIVRGAGAGMQDQLFKIVDRTGALLALRPEMTVPIARLAATRLTQDSAVLRLAYVAEVFRGQEAGQGRLREFTQAGVELIGEESLQGDAEVIALGATALRRAGLTDVIVNVGHLGFLRELMTELSTDEQDDVRGRLYRKDFPGIEEMVANRSRARALRDLPELHGPEAIARARALPSSSATGAALDELERLLDQLQAYGVRAWVGIDLGIIRDFSYYTGIVFEAYGRGMGAPLLGGGRYDGLLGRFGVDRPATGFALGLERIMAALPQDPLTQVALLLRDDASIRPETIRLAVELREQGVGVLLGGSLAWTEASRRAEVEGVRWVGYLDGTRVQLWEPGTGRQTSVNRAELASVLAGNGEGIAWSR